MPDNDSPLELARYLDAVVELTRHNDAQELVAALLAMLRANTDARHVALLTISNESRDTEFNERNAHDATVYNLLDVEADSGRPLTSDPELLACVCTQRPAETGGVGGKRVVFPVFGVHHVWALLVMEGLRTPVPRDLLQKLLRVFSHQMFALWRSQLDPLTGLYNRQSFYERIRRVDAHAMITRRATDNSGNRGNCFALIDIDHFKEVNDRFGHLYGDEVLLLLARLMMRSFRHQDLLFRYGGEEFAVVLVNADLALTERILERFRLAVAQYPFPRLEPKTISIGFTGLNVQHGVDKVLMCADKALYYAKNHGRNNICCYEKLIADGEIEKVVVAGGDIGLF
jgi:diguanylate cyclase (GGDEF)-like protein